MHRQTFPRMPLTRWLLGLVCVVVCVRGVRADSVVADIPIAGGTVALSKALGIDPPPERARFVTELVHILYDSAEGKSTSRDALRAQLALHLDAAAQPSSGLPADTVPLPLSPQIWSAAIFRRPVSPENLFATVVQDRSAALLSYGLAAVDDETLRFLAVRPAVLRRLYEADAAVFAAFAGSLHVRHNTIAVPGGDPALPLWEAVVGEPATSPDQFTRALFSRRDGRVAYLYDSVAQLDANRRAFVLGTWIADPGRRLDRFKSFLDALEEFPGWGVPERPFSRPPDDAVVMLTRISADDRGGPVAPSWRLFWAEAFASLDLPPNPQRRLRNVKKDGVIDAAWLADALLDAPTQLRSERLDQLAFGQRAFGAVPDQALPDALVAVRAFPRYRMLVLTLERLGIRTPGVYVVAVHHAERLAALDPARAFIALSQYQGALTLLTRLTRVHRLDVTQAEQLVTSLSSVPLTGNGYAGGVARWLRTGLLPLLDGGGADVDATILRSAAGPIQADTTTPVLVSWEERSYRVDLIEPEARRMTRTLQKVKAERARLALELDSIAGGLLRADLKVSDVAAATDALTTLLPLVGAPSTDKVNRAVRDLSKITRPADLQNAPETARLLQGLVDEMLASALRAWAYAIDLGDGSGARVIPGDVSNRHDFGLDALDNERRVRQPWEQPEQVIQPSVPWHVAGSLLGLDLGLSHTLLRRLSSDALPQPPRLLSADRDAFSKTVSLMRPTEVSAQDVEVIVAAIDAGRQRVAQLDSSVDTLDEIADEIAMDGWRRRALRWTLTNEAADAESYFSLSELLRLGRPPQTESLSAWGVAAVGLDGCLCTEFPTPGRWAVLVGRSRGGQIAGQVADLNLRVLLALRELHLPPSMAKGVLAAATQDYIDTAMPLYPDDWLTLVRSAQLLSTERIADYVAAMTVDGTLSPVAAASPRAR